MQLIHKTVDPYGNTYWRLLNSNKLHRTAGPAYINSNGSQAWYRHGIRHREDGPAVIDANGRHVWYVMGVDITDKVETWMAENNIAWPWDAATQLEFTLRFV